MNLKKEYTVRKVRSRITRVEIDFINEVGFPNLIGILLTPVQNVQDTIFEKLCELSKPKRIKWSDMEKYHLGSLHMYRNIKLKGRA